MLGTSHAIGGTLLCCRHAGDVPVFSVVPDTLSLGSSHGLLTTQDPMLDMLIVNLHPWRLTYSLKNDAWKTIVVIFCGANSMCILMYLDTMCILMYLDIVVLLCPCFLFNSFFLKICLQCLRKFSMAPTLNLKILEKADTWQWKKDQKQHKTTPCLHGFFNQPCHWEK